MDGAENRLSYGGSIKGVFVFALLACFSVLSLLIVLLGAKVYRNVDDTSERNFETRTALSYIAGKVRSSDASGMVRITTDEGAPVLTLSSVHGGALYETYIYYYDGNVCECFARADRGLNRSLGDALVATSGFSATLTGRMLTLSITDLDGGEATLSLLINSNAEEGAV